MKMRAESRPLLLVQVSSIFAPMVYLAASLVGRLGLSFWWVLPSALVAFGFAVLGARTVTLELQDDGAVAVNRRSIWKRSAIGTFTVRSWMSARLERADLVIEGRGATVVRLRTAGPSGARSAERQLNAMLAIAPDGNLGPAASAVIDLRDGGESAFRASCWVAAALIAAGWHPLALLSSIVFGAYPVVSAVRLGLERLFRLR
jgi:hypothetical protein